MGLVRSQISVALSATADETDLRDAEPVKQLQQQVQDALNDGDRISELSRQWKAFRKS